MSRGDFDKLFEEFDEAQPGRDSAGDFPSEEPLEGQGLPSDFGGTELGAAPPGAMAPSESQQALEKPELEDTEEEEAPRRPGIFARLAQTSPYVVMLFLSLLALIIGTLMLGVELWRYQFEIKPPG
ncbi:MAG: hypothetical protein NZ899_04935 [Thermoguttaceae bacterium]|nr:hypothetical protein [Thermoguttaceae bacterium]